MPAPAVMVVFFSPVIFFVMTPDPEPPYRDTRTPMLMNWCVGHQSEYKFSNPGGAMSHRPTEFFIDRGHDRISAEKTSRQGAILGAGCARRVPGALPR